MLSRNIGTINERGYIQGFKRRGFTLPKCLSELVANSIDSMDKVEVPCDKKLIFEVKRDTIKLIDNGKGMDETTLVQMYDMHSENHRSETSRGVSGIGSKPAQYILSEQSEVRVYTRTIEGKFLCAIAPWGDIHRNGVYTGMVNIREMTADEKLEFIQDRANHNMSSLDEQHQPFGTTTHFKFTNGLYELIESNFKPIDSNTIPQDRLGVVFGRDNVQMLYTHYEHSSLIPLPQFKYFVDSQNDYYAGLFEDTILQYHRSGKDRFIWKDGEDQYEIKQDGRGFSKDVAPMIEGLFGFKLVGTYKILTGLRRESTIYDTENPGYVLKESGEIVPFGASKKNAYSSYIREHIGDNEKYITHTKLVRNNQEIGLIPPEITVSSARADEEQYTRIRLVQCEVSFNPVSTHDNNQDRVMNVQENKTQHDGDSIPKNFTRLVAAIKLKHANVIYEHLKQLAIAAKHREGLQVETEVETEPESEDQTEPELEDQTEPESEPETPSPVLTFPSFIQTISNPSPTPTIPNPSPTTTIPNPSPTTTIPNPSPTPTIPNPVSSSGILGSDIIRTINLNKVYSIEQIQTEKGVRKVVMIEIEC
jgi:hypothetical protein